MSVEIVLDDLAAARKFIGSLNRKVVRQRFSSTGPWTPEHVALVFRGTRPVAMADCLMSAGRAAASAGLLAHPDFGGDAIRALLRLKRHVQAPHWHSTLRAPTASTIGISRRFFDTTHDQGAWEISNRLMIEHGPRHYFSPVPIMISISYLRAHAIPPLSKLDASSRAQIIRAAARPGFAVISGPNGRQISANDLMALAFDLLDVPFDVRQHVTRTMILSFAAVHGHDVGEMVTRHVDQKALGHFFAMATAAAQIDNSGDGIFNVAPLDQSEVGRMVENFSAARSPARLR